MSSMDEDRHDLTPPWEFTPDTWESSVEEPTRPRKVTENSRTEDYKSKVQYPRTTGSADDRPFITPPRKVTENSRTEDYKSKVQYPRTTGSADDRPFITPPRKPVPEKGTLREQGGAGLEVACKDSPEAYHKEMKGEYRVPLTAFEQELRRLINRFSMEGHSNTPDNILAEYLCSCLGAFDRATAQRELWYGRRTF